MNAPFNVNTVSNGVSAADFYMSVPSAVIKFLESDSQTKVLAKPQLRATEGQKVTLNLGEDVPVPSTTFTPLAAGGATTNPLTSYGYRTIGIIVEMEPRVTYEGDVIMNISVENSARGQDTNIAGQNLPSFFSGRFRPGCGYGMASRTCLPGCCARTSAVRCVDSREFCAFPSSSSCSRTTIRPFGRRTS